MDAMLIYRGKKSLCESLATLKETKELLEKGMGTSSPLEYALKATKQKWNGDEMAIIDDMIESATKLISTFETTNTSKEEDEKTWQEYIDEDVWKYICHISGNIDMTRMIKSYYDNHRAEILYAASDDLSDYIDDYIKAGLTNFADYGITLTIEEILAKCDVKGYAKIDHTHFDKTGLGEGAPLEQWAYHMLTHFFDAVILYDGYDSTYYNTNTVCSRVFHRRV